MCKRVFDTVRAHTSDVEPYSIDEAFIVLDGFSNVTSHC